MSLTPELIAVVGTLAGVLIGSLINLANNWITKRSDERRQLKELAINAAVEDWKQTTNQTNQGEVYPLALFIVYMAKVCDVALKPNVSRAELKSKLLEAREMFDELTAKRAQEDK
jgi:hypothetical protein